MRIHIVLDLTLLLLLLWVDYSVHRNIAVERIYYKKRLILLICMVLVGVMSQNMKYGSEGSDDKFTAASQAMY